jgi:hypothetical protein
MSSKITAPTVFGWPTGFDDSGRRVINDVGEFRLVEIWFPGGPQVVEYSDEIRAALDQARLRISDADWITKPHERVKLSRALYSLYFATRYGLNDSWFGSKLRETLGEAMVKATQARDVECAMESCAATVKAALRCVALRRGQRKRKPKPEVFAILEGERIFRETGERPSKSGIRAAMENLGIVFSKKCASAKWREIFVRAGLQNLAD